MTVQEFCDKHHLKITGVEGVWSFKPETGEKTSEIDDIKMIPESEIGIPAGTMWVKRDGVWMRE